MTLTAEQLDGRLTGIGASDAAVAMGLSPYRTPLSLYLEKVGEAEPADLSDNEIVRWGNILEPIIAREWSERTGVKAHRVNETLRHPEHDFMLCHLDFRQVGCKRVLEIKNVNQFHAARAFGDEGTDQVPDQYLVQVHHQIVITRALWGWDGGDLAALVGGNSLRVFSFEYDPELEALIVEKLAEFWKRVLDREPPEPTTIDDLTTLYERDNGEIKTVDASVFDLWQRYWQIKGEADAWSKQLDEVKDELRFAIAEAAGIALESLEGDQGAGIEYGGRTLATWKSQSSRRFNVAGFRKAHPDLADEFTNETTTRVLRVSKP